MEFDLGMRGLSRMGGREGNREAIEKNVYTKRETQNRIGEVR